MFISDFAIRRPVITIVTMLALVGFGVYALAHLETDEFPDIQAPIVAISLPYPGAAPETVERELLDPIEEAILSLSGIDEIQSTAQDSFAQVIAVFDFSKPVDQASQDVRDAISAIRGELPTEMEEPIIRRFDPQDLRHEHEVHQQDRETADRQRQFGSFIDPLAVLLSLPLSLIGVVLALLITGDTLNLMSLIGVILLMGVVAKNAILLLDFAKWSREQGMPRREAIVEAGRIRLRPILMTTVALIAGMMPVASGIGEGVDFRAPLGRAVVGGVLTSTILTLLVIPTIYEVLDDWRAWALDRWRRIAGLPEALPAT